MRYSDKIRSLKCNETFRSSAKMTLIGGKLAKTRLVVQPVLYLALNSRNGGQLVLLQKGRTPIKVITVTGTVDR